jgi:hypothetical protein
MKYNYKCIISKNGMKMYYKNVNNKWKRISNKMGEKAQKGKKIYRMKSRPKKLTIQTDFSPTGIDKNKTATYLNPENAGKFIEIEKKNEKEKAEERDRADIIEKNVWMNILNK